MVETTIDKSRSNGKPPIGADVFHGERQQFLARVADFAEDSGTSLEIRRQELRSTRSAIEQIAALAGVSLDA